MKQKISSHRRVVPTLLLTIFTVTLAYAPCSRDTFPGGCWESDCGLGCTITSYGPNIWQCYMSPDEACCQCFKYSYTCDCTFGEGSGQFANMTSAPGFYCNASSTLCEIP